MKLRNKRVLVTGAAGSLGPQFVRSLRTRECSVVMVDNLSGKSTDVPPGVEFVHDDFGKLDARPELLDGVDVIIHLAANTSVVDASENPVDDFKNNVVNTIALLETLRHRAAKPRLLYASTALAMGNQGDQPIFDESSVPRPTSFYGLSKLAGEYYCRMYRSTYGMPIEVVRFFNIYGPGQRKYVLYDILRKLSENGKELKMLGTGEEARDFIYIQDAIDGAFLILEHEKNGTYNVGLGKKTKIKELVDVILKSLNLEDVAVTFSGSSWKGDVKGNCADITRLKALGFAQKTTLEEGVKKLIAWIREKDLLPL